MTHATLTNLSRRALQAAAFFLAFAPLCFGSEPAPSAAASPLLGEMVVTATRVPPLMGRLVVTAPRNVAYVAVADLGSMTVNAPRETVLASSFAFGPR
jgi:hypothetical protein